MANERPPVRTRVLDRVKPNERRRLTYVHFGRSSYSPLPRWINNVICGGGGGEDEDDDEDDDDEAGVASFRLCLIFAEESEKYRLLSVINWKHTILLKFATNYVRPILY